MRCREARGRILHIREMAVLPAPGNRNRFYFWGERLLPQQRDGHPWNRWPKNWKAQRCKERQKLTSRSRSVQWRWGMQLKTRKKISERLWKRTLLKTNLANWNTDTRSTYPVLGLSRAPHRNVLLHPHSGPLRWGRGGEGRAASLYRWGNWVSTQRSCPGTHEDWMVLCDLNPDSCFWSQPQNVFSSAFLILSRKPNHEVINHLLY